MPLPSLSNDGSGLRKLTWLTRCPKKITMSTAPAVCRVQTLETDLSDNGIDVEDVGKEQDGILPGTVREHLHPQLSLANDHALQARVYQLARHQKRAHHPVRLKFPPAPVVPLPPLR